MQERAYYQAQAPSIGQRCMAEFLGTAFLVFIGAGTATAVGYLLGTRTLLASPDLIAIALAFGFALTIMIYAIGHISGSHINPAVSIALACRGHISWDDCWKYLVAQFLGGLVGALLIALAFPPRAATLVGYGATTINASFTNYFVAIVLEAIGTFFLLFVIMGTIIDRRAPAGWAGLAVGLTLAAMILVLGAVTGGSLNPARSFGPMIVQYIFGGSYPLQNILIYFIGPIIGGILGVLAYDYLLQPGPGKRAVGSRREVPLGGHD